MNKKILNLCISFIIILFLFEIFNHSSLIINTIFDSTILWYQNIVTTLFPIYITVDLLLNYGLITYLSKIFGSIMEKVFKIKKETSFIFLMSLISGFPSNSKYLKTLLDDKIINTEEANKLLTFTHFSNPLFIINSIGIMFLNDKKIGLIILIIHYLTNIIIGIFNRNYYLNFNKVNYQQKKEQTSFIKCLTTSIFSTIKTLLLIYGIITFFMLTTAIIKENIHINVNISAFLSGLLEMTQGIKFISLLDMNLILKSSLITFLLSFGGISIHMQVISILSDYKIKYSHYLVSRIIHGLISASLIYLILSFM